MTKYYCPSCNGELEINLNTQSDKVSIDTCRSDCKFTYWYDGSGKIVNVDYITLKNNFTFWIRSESGDINNVAVRWYNHTLDNPKTFNVVYDGRYSIEDLNGLVERTLKLQVFK